MPGWKTLNLCRREPRCGDAAGKDTKPENAKYSIAKATLRGRSVEGYPAEKLKISADQSPAARTQRGREWEAEDVD